MNDPVDPRDPHFAVQPKVITNNARQLGFGMDWLTVMSAFALVHARSEKCVSLGHKVWSDWPLACPVNLPGMVFACRQTQAHTVWGVHTPRQSIVCHTHAHGRGHGQQKQLTHCLGAYLGHVSLGTRGVQSCGSVVYLTSRQDIPFSGFLFHSFALRADACQPDYRKTFKSWPSESPSAWHVVRNQIERKKAKEKIGILSRIPARFLLAVFTVRK